VQTLQTASKVAPHTLDQAPQHNLPAQSTTPAQHHSKQTVVTPPVTNVSFEKIEREAAIAASLFRLQVDSYYYERTESK
jgi:hypothetical protein